MISIRPEGTIFLGTAHTAYAMRLDREGRLRHLYYGPSDQDLSQSDRLDQTPEHPDPGRRLTLTPLELGGPGLGDFRLPCVLPEYGDGSQACDLRALDAQGAPCAPEEVCRIVPGKPDLPGLPAFRPAEDTQTLIISLRDAGGLTALLSYTVYEELDLITRSVCYQNAGPNPLVLRQAGSACLDFPDLPLDWITLDGDWAGERMPHRTGIGPGTVSIGSLRGISGHQHNPSVLLCSPETDEETGTCWGFSLVYSGNFLIQAERSEAGVRLTLGIHPQHFAWQLSPGERFVTPEAAMICSGSGLGSLSRRFHRAIRTCLLPPASQGEKSPHPVLINSWESFYFDYDQEKLLSLARAAREAGADLFVLDDGWFQGRDSDRTSLGDWQADRRKLPQGLEGLYRELRSLGMDLGLWIEPEMVSPDSSLYRAHPDWALQIPGRAPVTIRNQLVLDFTRREVREEIFRRISNLLDRVPIRYLKYDMNRSLTQVWSAALPASRQGEVFHRYVLGVYDLQRRITQRYPRLLLEHCAAGGGRFDLGMLAYSPQIWCSDNTDALSRAAIQMGTSYIYPLCAMGAHYSAVPNETAHRTASRKARMAAALSGTFGYELDLTAAPPEERAALAECANWYRTHGELVRGGDLHRLLPPRDDSSGGAWMVLAPEGEEAAVFALGRQADEQTDAAEGPVGLCGGAADGYLPRRLPLRGLDAGAEYEVVPLGGEAFFQTGQELVHEGLTLPRQEQEVPGWIFWIRRV